MSGQNLLAMIARIWFSPVSKILDARMLSQTRSAMVTESKLDRQADEAEDGGIGRRGTMVIWVSQVGLMEHASLCIFDPCHVLPAAAASSLDCNLTM